MVWHAVALLKTLPHHMPHHHSYAPSTCSIGTQLDAAQHNYHTFTRSQAAPLQAVGTAASEFDIPAAPILLPEGPWKEIDGCVCAPKGFKAQGILMCTVHSATMSGDH